MSTIREAGEGKGNDLAIILQTPSNSTSLNKRYLSEINIMDVDDENSNKRIKTHPEREMTMQDEQSADDEKKGLILHQKDVQIR